MLIKIWLIFLIITRVHGGNRSQPRFFAEYDLSIDVFPFNVMILRSGFYQCGGTIVNFKWILTTARCVYGEDAESLSIISGVPRHHDDAEIEHKQVRYVKKFITHPDYKTYGQSQSDIALLYLTAELKESNCTKKANLYEGSIDTDTSYVDVYNTLKNGSCIGFGWGKVMNDGINRETFWLTDKSAIFMRNDKIMNSIFKKTFIVDALFGKNLFLIDFKTCEQYYDGLVENEHICAFNRHRNACKGDSGGSMVCKEKTSQQYILVGIEMSLNGCADEHPEILLSTVYYRNYILETMKNGFPKLQYRLYYLTVVVFIINR